MIRLVIYIIVLILTLFSSCNKQQASANLSEKTRYEKWTEDIVYFKEEYLNESKTFPNDSILPCKAILTDLKKQINTLSDNQITLQLSKCVAAKNLKVDKEIKLSYRDYIDNKDPILDWIINDKGISAD